MSAAGAQEEERSVLTREVRTGCGGWGGRGEDTQVLEQRYEWSCFSLSELL